MSQKKLYVGNLSFNQNDDTLRKLFEAFGTVSEATVIKDFESGRSKGFGFVSFEVDTEADAAIEALNDKGQEENDGRPLKVNEARPKEDRSSGGGYRGGNSGGGGYRSNR